MPTTPEQWTLATIAAILLLGFAIVLALTMRDIINTRR